MLLSLPALADDQDMQSVSVTGTKDPDWKAYRNMLDGLNAFDAHHALAPRASLKFLLRPQQPNLKVDNLTLRIVGDHTNIEVPIGADYTVSLPRAEAAARDDADLRLNTKKGLFRWRPQVLTPDLPPNARRLGDMRLECEVRWAVDHYDLSFLKQTFFRALGGPCHTSRVRIFYLAAAPIASATLVSGTRRESLPAERMDPHDNRRYAPPLYDTDWPDDTLVILELQSPDGTAAKAAGAPQPIITPSAPGGAQQRL
jgi:hypothetical protein